MRVDVIENGRRRLHLVLRTRAWIYLGVAALLVALGAWCIHLLAIESRTIVENGRISYGKTCLVRISCDSFHAAAGEVRGVGVVLRSHGLWRSYEVQVDLADGAHLLALPRSGGDEKERIARGIQAALASPGSSFRHEEGATLPGLVLGLVCIGCGIFAAFAIQTATLVADRDDGMVVVSRRRLLWPGLRQIELPLADLHSVDTASHTLRTTRHVTRSWWLRLRKHDGGVLPVASLPMFTEGQARDLAQLIRNWMKQAGTRVRPA